MSDSPFVELGLKRVINASGKMTALGGTAQTAWVADSQRRAAGHHVDLVALRMAAGERIARRTGAEAACVTTGAAAGIAIGVAAMITGTSEAALRRLPETDGLPSEILLQAGHDVDFGARVSQMIRLGGGRPVLVGQPDAASADAFDAAFCERSAGALYVQSHHSRQTGGLSLERLVMVCRARSLPVLVDAAAEEDLERYIAAGADLVTYSGGKAIGGPTVGFIAGRRELIAACEAQNRGIARAMKVGKEQIVGLLTALDRYPAAPGWPARLAELHRLITAAGGGRVSVEKDRAGRPIERVGLRLSTAEAARDLVNSLRGGDPAIYTRDHQVGEGLVLFDLREVSEPDVTLIAQRVNELLEAMDSRRGR